MGFLLHFGAQKQFSLVNDCFILLYFLPGSPLCPVSAYRRRIELIPAHRSCPVFLLPGPSGVVPLTKPSFVSQFRTCLSHIGVPHANRYRGHSFRRGAASWAFSYSLPGELIRLYGDWSSDSYKLYLEFSLKPSSLSRLNYVLPLFLCRCNFLHSFQLSFVQFLFGRFWWQRGLFRFLVCYCSVLFHYSRI